MIQNLRDEPEAQQTGVESVPGSPRLMTATGRVCLGTYLIILTVALVYLFGKLWPQNLTDLAAKGVPDRETLFGGLLELPTPPEIRALLLVICAGGLGGMLHTLRSYVAFAGNRQLTASWIDWYVVRPLTGALFALVFYLLIRGGLVTGGFQGGSSISVIGFAGVGALVGMFSEQATEKLKEVAEVLFSTTKAVKYADALGKPENPKPELTGMQPDTLAAGGSAREITLTGKNFVNASSVLVNDKPRPTKLASDGSLVATMEPGDLATAGQKQIRVVNPQPGGGISEVLTLKIS
jgi:hypothetical protein